MFLEAKFNTIIQEDNRTRFIIRLYKTDGPKTQVDIGGGAGTYYDRVLIAEHQFDVPKALTKDEMLQLVKVKMGEINISTKLNFQGKDFIATLHDF
jgi:hypothetical protein